MIDLSKFKAFADNKINATENSNFFFRKGKKHCGKRRKFWLPAFSLFPTMFSRGIFYMVINPFPNKPGFLHVCTTSLLKTLWGKEKLLVKAISPFPTMFSNHLENFLPFSSTLKLSSVTSFTLDESKSVRLGKG